MESRSEGVSVREATAGDGYAFAEFLVTAWREAGPHAPGFTGASDEAVAEITTPENLQERIGRPDRRMLLAWEKERVAGFGATRRITDDSVELSGIIVFRSRATVSSR